MTSVTGHSLPLCPVAADRLYRAGVHRLLAPRLLFGRLRLPGYVGVALVLAALKVVGRGHAANVAVDALRVDVVLSGDTLRHPVLGVRHEGGNLSTAPSTHPNESSIKIPRAQGRCARLRRVQKAARIALAVALFSAACRGPRLPEGASADRDAAAGRRVFERKCASCHNLNGDGRTIVAGHFPHANLIDGIWRADGTAAAIEAQIRLGKDPMPKFEGKLTDEEIRQTVAYVLKLSQAGAGDGANR